MLVVSEPHRQPEALEERRYSSGSTSGNARRGEPFEGSARDGSGGRVRESRRRGPDAERLGGELDRVRVEGERRRVGHAGDPRRRKAPVGCVEDVPHGQGVGDGEDRLLRALEELEESRGDAIRGVDPALAAARAQGIGLVRPGPAPVVRERSALVGAEPDLVERREDDPLDSAAVERELERLLRPEEPRRDAEPDGIVGDRRAQGERLLDAEIRQPRARRNGADAVVGVGACVRVPREDQALQNSTLRYASACCIPTVS